MTDRRELVTGSVLLLLGAVFLAANLLQVDLWPFVWPLALIVLGVALILRPGGLPFGGRGGIYFLSGVRRGGSFRVESEEFWVFVGDVDLDLRGAEWDQEEVVFRVNGFVGDINLWLPAGTHVTLASQALVSDVDFLGRKTEQFLMPVRLTGPEDGSAARKVRLEASFFILDVNVYQTQA